MPAPVFDALVHEPTRMRLCALLVPVESRDFAGLRDELGVSDSALSKHVRVLRTHGYVQTVRLRSGRRDHLEVALTEAGRTAFCGHVAEIQRLVTVVRSAEARRARRPARGIRAE
ncbi:transcriptional regulator [Austwickia chelonae]|uniref:transcriptional regulator n=1 Tax=Austwickia chelonae TaxID=100225 RepID=UPI00196767A1|nr:transcriptional regulator [Austwickia chelonae]